MKMRFNASQFTPTEFDTAADKARFACYLVHFIEKDFPGTLFTKAFYQRLRNTFGHIAHYDIHGFYAHFFTRTEDKVEFLKQTLGYGCYGDPAFTYSDVEKEVKLVLIADGVLPRYVERLSQETEAAERKQLATLKAKYEK